MKNFAALPRAFSEYSESLFAIVPVPFEKTTSYVKGTKKGPSAIIAASENLELYDEELDRNPAENGICTVDKIDEKSADLMISAVASEVDRISSDNKIPVILGGEHTVSIGAIGALSKRFPNLSVLHLDAHADLKDEYDGDKFSHACVMRRVLDCCPALHVGIRSLNEDEMLLIREQNISVIFARDMQKNDKWVGQALKLLTDDVYITLDLDALDPSVMSSVGTPEPGGILYYELLDFLRRVCKEKNVVGFDIVELCPKKGLEHPDFTAAKIAYKMIGYVSTKRSD